MTQSTTLEVWLRGPVSGIPSLLQPVAHALLQAREEVEVLMSGFPQELLWQRPAGVASAGFHLQHLTGVLDRLFTYALNQSLSEKQLTSLAQEGHPIETSVVDLVEAFHRQVDRALEQLAATSGPSLVEPRGVGRMKTPSTVIGLLVHAAEHTQRHTGQLLVTAKLLMEKYKC